MAPWGTKNHSKFSLGSTRAARGCPERLQGTPLDEKGWPEPLFFIKNHQKSWLKNAGVSPCFSEGFSKICAGRVQKTNMKTMRLRTKR